MCGVGIENDEPSHSFCVFGYLLDALEGRGMDLSAQAVLKLDPSVPDTLWERFLGPAVDYLEGEFKAARGAV